jgi:hypothetical protein
MKLKSMTAVRGILLLSALTLSALALNGPAFATECTNGANQWVYNGCCGSHTYYYGQSCIHGFWTTNGATLCSGICRF